MANAATAAAQVLATARGANPIPAVRLRQGQVRATAPTGVSVALGANAEVVGGVQWVNGYDPHVGDAVMLLQNGPDLLILGATGVIRGIHTGRLSGTSDGNAYIYWQHGAPFTPLVIVVEPESPFAGNDHVMASQTPTITATQATTRWYTNVGTTLNLASNLAITWRYVCFA